MGVSGRCFHSNWMCQRFLGPEPSLRVTGSLILRSNTEKLIEISLFHCNVCYYKNRNNTDLKGIVGLTRLWLLIIRIFWIISSGNGADVRDP